MNDKECVKYLRSKGYIITPPCKITTDDFDEFWAAYDKKVDKEKCIRIWNRMTKKERMACLQSVPDYVRNTPDKQYRRNPSTYLNNKSWLNEKFMKDERGERIRKQAEVIMSLHDDR